MSALGVSKLMLGGISPFSRAKATLITAAMPLAASRYPMFVLMEETYRGFYALLPLPKTEPIALDSTGSPALVPVPCAST